LGKISPGVISLGGAEYERGKRKGENVKEKRKKGEIKRKKEEVKG
jgi:hypothetical protein